MQRPVFRYAVVSDTHIRPAGESSSPWKTNLQTNDRARYIAHEINNREVDLVIHLGDIVHPVPHLPSHRSASMVAEEIMKTLTMPYYHVPGNHDVGDKDNPTVPAHIVNKEFIDYFKTHYGPTYTSFDYKDIHFVLINSSALNSGLYEEENQRLWLREDLEKYRGKRIHVFSHYPPYLYTPDEPDNYDNIDQPARGWLLDVLTEYGVEVFIAGHVHQYFQKKHHTTDIYNMLSTGNLRQDYANMFRAPAAEEYGRNDPPKLGYCIVDIYPEGHITHIKRSYGKTLEENESIPKLRHIDEYYPNPDTTLPLGVEIRYPLAETTTLPYMGPLNEYNRKITRNDYTYLGLWETGIRLLRLPLSDLQNPVTRERLEELHEQGFRYGFFSLYAPPTELIKKHRDLIEYIEVITPWEKVDTIMETASNLRKDLQVPVYIAKIESSIHHQQTGSKFSHTMTTGFTIDDTSKLEQIDYIGNCDGFVFQIQENKPILETTNKICEYAKEHGFKPIITVKLSPENPADYPNDDNHHANRVAEALIASHTYTEARMLLDTYMDHDRGYYPRSGLYDRLLNPRSPAMVLRSLEAALTAYGSEITAIRKEEKQDTTRLHFKTPETQYTLNLPKTENNTTNNSNDTVIDLLTGVINPTDPPSHQSLSLKPHQNR